MSDQIMMLLLTNTLGESILVETLRSAAYFYIHSSNGFIPHHKITRSKFQESRYCYFFIQSTCLDNLIEAYCLDYNPNDLREGFNYLVRHSL